MLGDSMVFATLAVKDLAAGKEFYGGTLGLKELDQDPGGVRYVSGGGKLYVYQSPTAGTGQATTAAWEVDDIEAMVAALKDKGVTFEAYDIPGATRQDDIYVMGGMKAAWFKDPDGNILSLGSKA